ncbi:MAG: YfhO family protein, partial [Clostridia bacterium]|nr:YfhO family protein [Clostridia bacterium]
FFYMIVIFTVIYVAVRFITFFKSDFKAYIKPFFTVAFSSVIGVMIAAALFLPTVLAFLGDFRSSVDTTLDIFYKGAYAKIFASMFAYNIPTTWLILCLSVLFLPCLIMLFIKRKENLHLKIFYITSIIFMIFPIFGKIFNGFSYVNNRWIFAYTLLMSFIIVRMFDELMNANKKHLTIVLFVSTAVSILALFLGDTKSSQMIIPFVFLLGVLILFALMGRNKFDLLYLTEEKSLNIKKTVLQIACIALTVISITNYSYHILSNDSEKFSAKFYKTEQLKDISYVSNEKIKKMTKDDNTFWRYTGRGLDVNSAFIDELKSTQYYWSLSNGNISKYRYDMNIAENVLHFYTGLDDRTALNALSSVKYYYNGQYEANKSLPYGYEQLSTRVSENKMYLPLGYTYDSFITREEFDKLPNSIEKQEMMLNTAVLEETTESLKKNDYKPTSKELKYTITHLDDSIAQNGNTFIVDKANSEFVLEFDTVPDSETYFCVKGVEYVPGKVKYNKTTFRLTSTDADNQKYSKSFFYYTPEANFYSGRQDFDVNLGYTESGINKLRFKFPHIGTYKFDEIKIISQPMSEYESSIKVLKKDVLENVVVDYNEVSGTIKLDQTKLLCLSIPYSSGWTAVVDGKEAELIQTNGMHSGLLLDKGEHDIKLTYKTPGFRYGIIISLAGIALFTLTAVYYCRKKKKAK